MSDYLTFALPKGRIMQDSMELFAKVGITCPEMDDPGRKLVFDGEKQEVVGDEQANRLLGTPQRHPYHL